MSGKRHHVVNRIATFIKIGHTTSSGRMEAYQFVFRNCHDGSFSTTVLLTANSLINTASRSKNLNDFVGLHLIYNRKANLLIVFNQWRYFLQYRNFNQLFRLFLVERYYSLPYVNPEKPDVPLNKNDAFQKVQKRRVQEKR